jgi:transcriptional repressor NrdR
MVCIYCGYSTDVINSRHQIRNNHIWRRRRCQRCKTVFTTSEMADMTHAVVVIRHNQPQEFISDKLFSDILLCLKHRKDRYTASRELTDRIIRQLYKPNDNPSVETTQISGITGGVLKRFDRQAWLRYAAEHPSLQG